jgi:hypothetical protein
MSYNSDVRQNPATLEHGKFVEIVGDSRFPATSVVRVQYPEDSSMPAVTSVDVYPKYAVATFLANASDISIQLSASEVDIGNVGLVDNTSGSYVYGQIIQTGTVSGLPVGAVSVRTQNYPQLDALTAVDYATNTTVRSLTAVEYGTRINNTAAISGSVTVLNQVSSLSATILNSVSAVSITNTVAVSTAQTIPVSGSVTVLNQVSSLSATVLNQLTGISVTNDVQVHTTNTVSISTAKTLPVSGYVTLKDVGGNNVAVTAATSALNVNVTNPIVATVDATSGFPVTFAHTPNFDAFGRLRTSAPLTLFDSSHRYRDNNLWSSLTAAGGSYAFNANQGLVDLTVSGLSGSSVVRETTKVFAYQPGKSLLTLNTFVMAPSANNLRQRVGYFGQDNGMYFQLSGGQIGFVERSLVNGSPTTETIVPLSAWNGDKLDGSGSSGFTLDVTKAQILWMDVEWLGLGTVRMGFVIDGKFIVCHSFHHANKIASTYITTASLPLRYEITNTGATGVASMMKQVCSTVISEGGYELRGLQQAIGTPIAAPKILTLASTFYPVATIRLKATRLDAIVILTAISLLPVTNGAFYEWRVIASGATAGGAGWVDAGPDSAVEYKLNATSVSGGRVLASGFMQGSNQGSPSIDILKEALFKFQLERDGLTATPYELTLAVATNNAGSPAYGSMDWEEISR